MDRALFRWIHGLRSPALDPIAGWLSRWGYWIPPVFFLGIFLWRRRAGAVSARDGLLAWFLSVMVAEEWVKPLVKRARPPHDDALRGLVHVLGETPRRGSLSFPSGSAAALFAGATVAWLVLGRRAGLCAMGLAALVALSRVYAGVHYPGDLLGGALIGCAVTVGVWRFSRWAGPG
jgi:undecaprenyl-diphosphatase